MLTREQLLASSDDQYMNQAQLDFFREANCFGGKKRLLKIALPLLTSIWPFRKQPQTQRTGHHKKKLELPFYAPENEKPICCTKLKRH